MYFYTIKKTDKKLKQKEEIIKSKLENENIEHT